jgi:hypothetical protein
MISQYKLGIADYIATAVLIIAPLAVVIYLLTN